MNIGDWIAVLAQNQIQEHKITGDPNADWISDHKKDQQFEQNICNAVIAPPDSPDAHNNIQQKDQDEKPLLSPKSLFVLTNNLFRSFILILHSSFHVCFHPLFYVVLVLSVSLFPMSFFGQQSIRCCFFCPFYPMLHSYCIIKQPFIITSAIRLFTGDTDTGKLFFRHRPNGST